MYLYSLGEYWRRTGDRKVLEEFWASAQKAYAYCISTLAGDGLMDNTKAGLAAVEVGVLRGKVTKDIYLEGFWLAGAQSMAQMAAAMADTRLAADARARAGKAAASLAADWWNADGDFFAFGITDEGKRADLLGVWPAVLLSLTADIPPGKRESATQVLARPELATDWGIRSISNQSPLYDPVSYNNGTAWPFMGAFAAWAQYRQNQTLAGFHTWSSIAHLTGIMAPGAVPEHMVGNRNEPGERAVPRQLFSSLGVLLPATRGLLGLEPDAPAHKIRFAPRLPADWPSATFSRLRVGDLELGGEIGQEKGLASITLSAGGSPSVWQVELSAAIPLGAQVRSVTLNGRPAEYQQSDASDRTLVTLAFALAPHTQVLVHYDGGIAIVPPPVHPQPGDSAATLRIVSVALDRGRRELRLGLAGLGGHTYQLELLTGLPAVRVQGGTIQSTPTGYTLELSFPESTDYATQDVQIHY
jgi:hypothetical protein